MRRTARRIAVAAPLLLLAPGGCEGSRPRPTPAPATAADKAALFGDPSLVPTREGERARRELALAQEIEQAIDMLPSVARARVDVELSDGERAEPPRVLAVVLGQPGAELDALAARVRKIAHAVTGPGAAVEVVASPSPDPTSPPPERPWWPLLLGVLGLGWCGGTLVERARRLRRARADRPAPR